VQVAHLLEKRLESLFFDPHQYRTVLNEPLGHAPLVLVTCDSSDADSVERIQTDDLGRRDWSVLERTLGRVG
jgi:hypothetical protein